MPDGDIFGCAGRVISPEGDQYDLRWTSPAGESINGIPYETLKRLAECGGVLVVDADGQLVVEDAP